MFDAFVVALTSVWADSGFSALTGGHVIMIGVGLLLLYMAIGKGFEPLLLSPIAFGCILAKCRPFFNHLQATKNRCYSVPFLTISNRVYLVA